MTWRGIAPMFHVCSLSMQVRSRAKWGSRVEGVVRHDGQWVGRADGDTPGWVTLELEPHGDHLAGVAYHYPDDPELNALAVDFVMEPGQTHVVLNSLLTTPFAPHNGTEFRHDDLGQHFPNAMVSKTADLTLTFNGERVAFEYSTPPAGDYPGSRGSGVATKAHSGPPLTPSHTMSWDDFRAAAFTPERGRFLYRGQSNSEWRLRTTFHRSPLKNLTRYRQEIAADVFSTIAPLLPMALDLSKPEHTGAFYNLLQHHGFPTPLLDWSHSPFIAAYFAFEGRRQDEAPEGHVRIFMFDWKSWSVLPQQPLLSYTSQHVSLVRIVPLANPRWVPQQASVTLTNVDDIEAYFARATTASGVEYLRAIDIPVTDRKAALNDLAVMGIHHGSLFPGLDGTCRSLAHKHFGA